MGRYIVSSRFHKSKMKKVLCRRGEVKNILNKLYTTLQSRNKFKSLKLETRIQKKAPVFVSFSFRIAIVITNI